MKNHDALIRRLMDASCPSRELDADVCRVFDPEGLAVYHVGAGGEVNAVTKRIDAALMLVPQDYHTLHASDDGSPWWTWSITDGWTTFTATSAFAAIAICICALRVDELEDEPEQTT